MYVCMYVCMYVYIYIYIHMHIHTYKHDDLISARVGVSSGLHRRLRGLLWGPHRPTPPPPRTFIKYGP